MWWLWWMPVWRRKLVLPLLRRVPKKWTYERKKGKDQSITGMQVIAKAGCSEMSGTGSSRTQACSSVDVLAGGWTWCTKLEKATSTRNYAGVGYEPVAPLKIAWELSSFGGYGNEKQSWAREDRAGHEAHCDAVRRRSRTGGAASDGRCVHGTMLLWA